MRRNRRRKTTKNRENHQEVAKIFFSAEGNCPGIGEIKNIITGLAYYMKNREGPYAGTYCQSRA